MDSLQFSHLWGGYEQHQVFRDFTASFPRGSFIALTGPNGSGKSTLLKFIYKQLLPDQGLIYLDGEAIATMKQMQIARHLGFVPQNGKLDYAFTVREAVAMGRFAYQGKDEHHAIEAAMDACDISHLAHTLVTELSGGEMQRVLLARSLSQDGKLLLLDEPVNHLDVRHQHSIMQLLTRLVEQGYTVLCVLHDLLLVQVYSSIVMVLKDGSIVSYGKTEEVITEDLLHHVYGIDAHQVYDATLDRSLYLPSWH
ncbi:MAG: ABC transporter ATP-binding protein [Sphaerochaeta sp.]|jgi:iron complex transport system ATP-binding protein|uniref:ABC transporter ATP-binding protein n=1 Tax=Sphaerochaeta sp. TaxID=1972642 RepID=UPI002FCB9F14